ncbi:hypothetical protein JOQ06_003747, partial [Pogonophryne albipinna]
QNEGVQKKAVIYGIVNKERKRERIKNDEEHRARSSTLDIPDVALRPAVIPSFWSLTPRNHFFPGGSPSNLNMNLYATKKTASEGMYYVAVLVLISFSLALQIVAGVLIIIIARRDINEEANQKRMDSLNNTITIIIFLIFVTNIFITVFGMERTGLFARMHY